MSVIRKKPRPSIKKIPWWVGLVVLIIISALATAGPGTPPTGTELPSSLTTAIERGAEGPIITSTTIYPFGQCTWLAAKLRPDIGALVSGNANNWANVLGVDYGTVPRLNSVVVYQPWIEGAGAVGHVAVVVKVISDTTWIEEGMNAPIFGQVVYRVASITGGIRFLYGPKGTTIPAQIPAVPADVPIAGPRNLQADANAVAQQQARAITQPGNPSNGLPMGTLTYGNWMVTLLSVVGDKTYADPPDLIGIRYIVQEAKREGARQMTVPLSQIGVWTYPDGPYDLVAIRMEVQRQKANLGAR